MLIEFSVSNFRSVRQRQSLSLVASPGAELAGTNTFESEGGKQPRLVRSAVIYGPNAAGKSNLLRAAAFSQAFVINSAVQSQEGRRTGVAPFAFSKSARSEPSEFEWLFAETGVRYHYGFAITQERVTKEWLVAYPVGKPQRWFERAFDPETGKDTWTFGPNFKGEKAQQKIWSSSTRANALFLSTAIQLNNDQLKPVFGWIQSKLAVLVPEKAMNPVLSLELLKDQARKALIDQFMRAADIGIESMELREEDMQPVPSAALPAGMMRINIDFGSVPGAVSAVPPKLLRVLTYHKQVDATESVALDFNEESDGTKKLFEFAGGWIKALQDGATLLVDELDRSLHPHMTRFLVGLFHDNARNDKGAQLVFTTHDTTLLDTELFRRDQVWFVEKDKTASTRLYPLLEYSPRKHEALERGYLKGRYGAIPFIGPVNF